MENNCRLSFYPQPSEEVPGFESHVDGCATKILLGVFRGKKSLILIFSLLFALACFAQTGIEYQNKRLDASLKKNGTAFSQLEEISCSSIINAGLEGKFFKINSKVSDVKYVFVGRVNSCRAGGCSIPGNTMTNAESEYFDYFILFDSAKTVKQVEVFNYQATHGYEITAKGWLKQFIGFTEKDTLLVNKDIDAISGATVSVFAITGDVQQKTRLLNAIN